MGKKMKNQAFRPTSGQTGFTLIEALLYTLFISFIIFAALGSTYQLIEGSEALKGDVAVDEEVNFLVRKMEWYMTGIDTIVSPAEGASATYVTLNKQGFGSNPVTFSLIGDDFEIDKNGTGTLLNSDSVVISSVSFEHIPANGSSPDGIHTVFWANDVRVDFTKYARN